MQKGTEKVYARDLRRELERGKVFPVYLLLGEDHGAKEEVLEMLARRVIPGNVDAAVAKTVYFGSEAEAGDILSSLRTYAFFDTKKLVIVKEFDRIVNPSSFIEYIRLPNEDSVLVLMTDLNRVGKRVMDAVSSVGRVCVFWPMFRDESERWVQRRLKELEITADREAVHYIVELSGTGKSELDNQTDIIGSYLQKGERLTMEKATHIVSRLQRYTVFDLTGALFLKPTVDILSIYHSLLDNGEDLGKLFFFINREIQKLLHAFALKSRGLDFARVTRVLKLKKRDAERIRTILGRMDLRSFRALYAGLHTLDHTLKSSPRELSLLSFERFISGLGA
jgi:DNA polymerase III delta subunit